MEITDFLVMDSNGREIPADSFGNKLAFSCENCGHPMLASSLENQPGSDDDCPAVCRGCASKYSLDVRAHAKKLYIHHV